MFMSLGQLAYTDFELTSIVLTPGTLYNCQYYTYITQPHFSICTECDMYVANNVCRWCNFSSITIASGF